MAKMQVKVSSGVDDEVGLLRPDSSSLPPCLKAMRLPFEIIRHSKLQWHSGSLIQITRAVRVEVVMVQ